MQRISILFLLLLAFQIAAQSSSKTELTQQYTVSINEQTPLRLFVEAQIETAGDTLFMHTNCPNYDYPEGWSTFVKNLAISEENGKLIDYEYHSKSKWHLKEKSANVLSVRYEIDLSFTREKWDVGNEQAGFSDDAAIYLVSKAIFLFPEEDTESTVTFNLPDSWKLSVPWEPSQSAVFQVPNREFLVENSLVMGNFYDAQLREGGFDFRIALLGETGKSGDRFSSVLTKIARAYLDIFQDTPPAIFLITVFYADIDDGESFYNSTAFTLKNPIDENNKIIWTNQMAHELFHYWNSDLLLSQNYADRQWFSEGTAEYYANLTMVREQIIDEAMFRNKIEKVLGLYQNYRGWRERETSLLASGERKGKHRFLVYNGGWAVAMALDVIIMEETNGQKTLDDFMAAMLKKHSTVPYSYQDLVKTASETAGKDLSEFFAKYVEGTDLLPLNEITAKLGYDMLDIIYEAEIYLLPKANPGFLHNRWLRRKPY